MQTHLAMIGILKRMTYSQKYCIVHFITPVQDGAQFHMDQWPLHITLADVFAIDRQNSGIDKQLTSEVLNHSTVKSVALHDSQLGSTHVTLLEKTHDLVQLHSDVVSLLNANGAIFNTPEFNDAGYIPHSTIQQAERLNEGDEIVITSLSLVDMFVDGDWQQRKVLRTFDLS